MAALDSLGDIVLCGLDGSRSRPLVAVEEGEVPIQWSADGRALYVYRPNQRPVRVFGLEVATGRRRLCCGSSSWRVRLPPDGPAASSPSAGREARALPYFLSLRPGLPRGGADIESHAKPVRDLDDTRHDRRADPERAQLELDLARGIEPLAFPPHFEGIGGIGIRDRDRRRDRGFLFGVSGGALSRRPAERRS